MLDIPVRLESKVITITIERNVTRYENSEKVHALTFKLFTKTQSKEL